MKTDVAHMISSSKKIKDLEELHMKFKDFINVLSKVVKSPMDQREA